MAPTLSILIPTLASRVGLLSRLMSILRPQLTDEVEVVLEQDEGQLSIGAKRNRLLARATGDYVSFIDDDDTVSADYVATLLDGIAKGVDVVNIRGIFTTNGTSPSPFYDVVKQGHSVSQVNGEMVYKRGVQHLDATRRSIATAVKFPDTSFGEDYEWGVALERTELIRTWCEIDHPIYFYDYRYPKERDYEPAFAVVVPCFNHCYTTHKSIESLLTATECSNFILVMVDDGSTDDTSMYGYDLTERLGSRRFHYHRNSTNLGVNASWNIGVGIARARGAKTVAICNNDILYAPGWDVSIRKSLEDSTVGVISPLSTYGYATPWDWPRGETRNMNPAGYMGYMPILGACFACRISLFDEIGPFPEDLRIYFGDNWIALAAQHAGYECGYDNDSYIHHLMAITTANLDNGPIWDHESPIWERISAPLGKLRPAVPAEEMKDFLRDNQHDPSVKALYAAYQVAVAVEVQ